VFTLIKIRNKTPDISSTEKLTFIKNISPYLLLTFVLLTSRMIPSFQENLNSTFNIKMENYDFELPLLYSPGFFLILSCIFVIILFKLSISNILESLTLSVQKCFPVILTTFLFIFISEIMAESGMIYVLSNFAAYSFGAYFIYLSPFIGAVGGFLTGSNTASNTMFIKLQTQTAAKIGSTPLLAACTQNVSSSMITMINPSRVTLSTSVCKVGKHENIIQKKMIFIVAGTLSVLVLEIFLFSLCI
jgi:lactate permease